LTGNHAPEVGGGNDGNPCPDIEVEQVMIVRNDQVGFTLDRTLEYVNVIGI